MRMKTKFCEKKFYILIKILLVLFFSCAMNTSWDLCRSRKTKKTSLNDFQTLSL